MTTETVTLVRIYIREQENLLGKVFKFLREDSQVAGVTVLRGVEGFSGAGEAHTAFLVDLSLDLPLVIEFYDEPARVEAVIAALLQRFPLPHIVSWVVNRHKT